MVIRHLRKIKKGKDVPTFPGSSLETHSIAVPTRRRRTLETSYLARIIPNFLKAESASWQLEVPAKEGKES